MYESKTRYDEVPAVIALSVGGQVHMGCGSRHSLALTLLSRMRSVCGIYHREAIYAPYVYLYLSKYNNEHKIFHT